MKYLENIIFSLLLLTSSNVFSAWDGNESGVIKRIDVTNGGNYGFRVTLEGSVPLCGNGHSWAYLNESFSNYNTFVSALMAAHMAKRSVTLYTNREQSSGNEYCKIGYLVVQ